MLRALSKVPMRSFASTAFVNRSFDILDEAKASAKAYEAKNQAWLDSQSTFRLPEDGIYKHPYCTKEHPLWLHSDDIVRDVMKVVGPEQVSPHFQSIEEFGKWFNYFFIGLMFTVSMRSHQNHAFGYCFLNMMFGLEVWLYTLGLYFLRATVMITPNPWKQMWEKYNMDSMMASMYEVEENLALERIKGPKEQYDYLKLHREYLGMKANLLDNHLESSRVQLKKHTYERALAILRTTDMYENSNLSGYMNEELVTAVANMKAALTGKESQAIKDGAFASALTGIKKGSMTYENDPLLPILLKEIEAMETKAKGMTDAQITKIMELNKEQKQMLMTNDASLENKFLHSAPPLKHPRVLQSPGMKEFRQ